MKTPVNCSACSTPTNDTDLCGLCWTALAEDLRDLAGYNSNGRGERMIPLAVELEVVLSRQERQARARVQITGTPERPLPVNLKAGEVRDHLHTVLAVWAAAVADSRGLVLDSPGTMMTNAQFLLHHQRDVRTFHAVDDLLAHVTDAVDKARRVIDSRSVRVYVGQCGAEIEATEHEAGFICTVDLWADSAYAMTRCNFCSTSWPSMERWEQYTAGVRQQRLGDVARKELGARQMATVLSALGVPIDESTIRKHARLQKIHPAGLDDQGRKLYLVADVLALVATPRVSAA